ncbi:EP0 [Scenedesmus sp. PABB004]|nr:EP0 [Scenedesmus sp. PABB004]
MASSTKVALALLALLCGALAVSAAREGPFVAAAPKAGARGARVSAAASGAASARESAVVDYGTVPQTDMWRAPLASGYPVWRPDPPKPSADDTAQADAAVMSGCAARSAVRWRPQARPRQLAMASSTKVALALLALLCGALAVSAAREGPFVAAAPKAGARGVAAMPAVAVAAAGLPAPKAPIAPGAAVASAADAWRDELGVPSPEPDSAPSLGAATARAGAPGARRAAEQSSGGTLRARPGGAHDSGRVPGAARDAMEALQEDDCPVCLQALKSADRAVVRDCMHAFCLVCLQAWCRQQRARRVRRTCPLCKGRIRGYLHTIRGDADYAEHLLSDDDCERGARSPARAPSPGGGEPPGWRAAVLRGTARPAPGRRQRPGGGGGGEGAAGEPRPYWWRVQHALASVARGGGTGGAAQPGGGGDAALEARREVYYAGGGLWAQPHHTAVTAAAAAGASAAAPGGGGGGARRGGLLRVPDAALEAWIARELSALLREPADSLLVAFVKGLVGGYGISLPQRAPAAAAPGPVGQGSSALAQPGAPGAPGPAAALAGFLGEDTAVHFWHELVCFASSGLSVSAWDRAVRYERRTPPGGSDGGAAGAAQLAYPSAPPAHGQLLAQQAQQAQLQAQQARLQSQQAQLQAQQAQLQAQLQLTAAPMAAAAPLPSYHELGLPIRESVGDAPMVAVHRVEWAKARPRSCAAVLAGEPVEINPSVGAGYAVMSADEWAARFRRSAEFPECLACGGANTREHAFSQTWCRGKCAWEAESLCLDCLAFSHRAARDPEWKAPEQHEKERWTTLAADTRAGAGAGA